MFLTYSDIHITSTDEFEFSVFYNSFCKWTRGLMSTILTQC